MNQTQAIQSAGRFATPVGEEVTVFSDYAAAQKAVDTLSDSGFPVQNVQIVGRDLRLVENVTGRLTAGKAIGGGALSGAWLGVMVGLLWLIMTASAGAILWGAALGALWGAILGAIPYFMSRGTRDFTSTTSAVPGSFALHCRTETLAECRRMLIEKGLLAAPSAPVDLSTPPLYGERLVPGEA